MSRTHATLRRQTEAALSDPSILEHLTKSITGLAQTVRAIQKTKGAGWAQVATDDEGHPLFTADEQKRFTAAFAPYVEGIVGFFESKQRGGAEEHAEPQEPKAEEPQEPKAEEPQEEPAEPSIANLTGLSNAELAAKRVTTAPAAGRWGIDELYTTILKRVDNVDSALNHYASQYGILRLEKAYDLDHDIPLIPPALSTLALEIPGGGVAVKEFLDRLRVPFRMLVFGVYLFLDVTRVTAGVTGMEESRRMLSIVVCLLDFLRGDWKKATLSFLGYYGVAPMMYGQTLKGFLTLFRMLSPTMQQTFLLGALDTVKSLLIGFLLAAFQITAPESIRLPLIGVLEKIAQGKAMLDGELVKAGMSPRADHFAPTFEDLNNLQSIMEDRAFLCSTEYQTLLEQVDRSAIIHIILQLMRIPVTAEFREMRCGKHTPRPFLEELVARGKAAEAAEEPKEPAEGTEEPKEPAESAEEPKEPAETTEEPKEPEEPAEEPKRPEEPAEEPKRPEEPAEEPKKPEEPAEASEPAEAAEASEPEEPAEASEPAEPAEASEPEEPAEPVKPVPLPPTIGGRRRRPHCI